MGVKCYNPGAAAHAPAESPEGPMEVPAKLLALASSVSWDGGDGVLRTLRQILRYIDVSDADIWVMNSHTLSIDDQRPLSDNDVLAVRGVKGVEWAVPFYKGMVVARQSSGSAAIGFASSMAARNRST